MDARTHRVRYRDEGRYGGKVTDSPTWTSVFAYQLAVLSCATFTHFLLYRNNLWQLMGETDRFYRLLANFTAEVIGCIKGGTEEEQQRHVDQLVCCNHRDYQERLRQVQPGSSYLLKNLTVQESEPQ